MQNMDEFELKLEQMLKKLHECQENHSLKSCFECELLLECELRDEYVKALYNSMSKGDTGGFEF